MCALLIHLRRSFLLYGSLIQVHSSAPKEHLVLDSDQSVEYYSSVATLHVEQALRCAIHDRTAKRHHPEEPPRPGSLWHPDVPEILHDFLKRVAKVTL